ncbi:MAG: hypothetical protein ACOCXG_05820 [Nanoarchaeota archaeon]
MILLIMLQPISEQQANSPEFILGTTIGILFVSFVILFQLVRKIQENN